MASKLTVNTLNSSSGNLKIVDTNVLDISNSTKGIIIPAGTDQQQQTPSGEALRYNTDQKKVLVYPSAGGWREMIDSTSPAAFTKPGFFDDFIGNQLNTGAWDTYSNTGDLSFGDITVSNSELTIVNRTGGSTRWLGVVSKRKFGVGTTIEVRSKNTIGRHSAVIGFGGVDYRPYPHGGSSAGGTSMTSAFTWYSRADNVSSNISMVDEVGLAQTNASGTQDLRQYQIFKIERPSPTEVRLYRNDVLEYVANNVVFANDYSAYFSTDGWFSNATIVVDYIRVY